jgi:hypothetical protein
VPAAASGARCGHCGTAHLVVGRSELEALVVADRVADGSDARRAVVEDLGRRRLVELSFGHASLAAGGAEPLLGLSAMSVDDHAHRVDAAVVAEAATWAARLDTETEVVDHLVLLAPYLHLSARVWEGSVARSRDGRKISRLSVRRVELSGRAFGDEPELPEMGALSALRELHVPDSVRAGFPILPVDRIGERLDELRRRALLAHGDGSLECLARSNAFWGVRRLLVLRPFHLLTVRIRGEVRTVLVDGAARACSGTLSSDAAARLVALAHAAAPALPSSRLTLRPMRCPVCAGPLPLQRAEEVRFCRTCGRAFSVVGSDLVPVAYSLLEARDRGRSELPFWRIPFALCDPADGSRLESLAALHERLRNPKAATAGHGREPIEVPAFRFLERRWPLERARHLLEREPAPEVPRRPQGGDADRARPSRIVAIPAAEALAVARVALLLTCGERTLAGAAPGRIRQLLFTAPLELGAPSLVLRSFARGSF